jgi:DNA polymerase III sliding clamp (beta) subunit (PCNA family)
METTLNTRTLTKLVTLAQATIDPKTKIPAAAYIALTLPTGGGARVESTDFDTWFVGTMAANNTLGDAIGSVVCLPGKELLTALKAHKDPYITIESIDAHKTKVGAFTLTGIDPAEYPVNPFADKKDKTPVFYFRTKPAELARALSFTGRAASTDPTRYNLNAICLQSVATGARVKLTATDGHRLHTIELNPEYSQVTPYFKEALVSTRAADIIGKCLKGSCADAACLASYINFAEFFLVPNPADDFDIRLYGRLIDGEFPDYNQVIPKAQTYAIEHIKADDLSGACTDILKAFGNCGRTTAHRGHCARVTVTGARLDLHAKKESSELTRAIDARADMEDPLVFGINSYYLRDAVAEYKAANVKILASGPLAPIEVIAEGHPDELALIMPMRLENTGY